MWLSLTPSLILAQLDFDRDGLGDVWQQIFELPDGTSEEDPDGDGASNLAECHAGTDPNDNTSVFVAEDCHWNLDDESICIRWQAIPGKRYHVVAACELNETDEWIRLGNYDHSGPQQIVELSLQAPEGSDLFQQSQCFVRIVVSDRDDDGDGVTAWEETMIGTEDDAEAESDDHEAALDWLDHQEGEEGEEGEAEFEDLLFDLWVTAIDDVDTILEEVGSDSVVGQLALQLNLTGDEEAAWDHLETLSDEEWDQLYDELLALGWIEDDEEPEDVEEPEDGEMMNPGGLPPVDVPPLFDSGRSLMSLSEASRFLTQATLGADYETIEAVSRSGIEAWLDYQFSLPKGYHQPAIRALAITSREDGEEEEEADYRWAWWEQGMKSPDTLRQRIAFALSEILVVGDVTDVLEDSQEGLAAYYDILIDGAFGNYRDILYRVSTHSVMGHWLSHAKNQPTDVSLNRFPDENYARELMQLFSIGLFELNQDGTRKLDPSGDAIPTYDNQDITELARVFTGLTYPPPSEDEEHPDDQVTRILTVDDYLNVEAIGLERPMFPFEPMHEGGSKTFLGRTISGGSITQDLNAAIDVIFNHPNVGPFICHRLIQRLVTSNPSPGYVSRVAAAFNDNGSGTRGDMTAVVRAILLDAEARDLSFIDKPYHGMLREPYVRYIHLCRAFNATTNSGAFRNLGFPETFGQLPMQSPSVFNFFLPDHQPQGPIADAGLVAPEFQITTATTTASTINFWGNALREDLMDLPGDQARLDLTDEIALANNIPALIDRLDIILTRGNLADGARQIIQQTVTQASAIASDREIVELALYLFLNSPDFAVLR